MHWLKRQYQKLYIKVIKERAAPEYIARGWACGMFIGCAIPFGVQLYISIPLSFIIKGSKIGAALGTFITNPITIFFIYPAQCWVGSHLLGKSLSYSYVATTLKEVLAKQDWASLVQLSGHLVASFFVGGLLLAGIMTPITYYGILSLVRKARAKGGRKCQNA